MRNWKKFRRMVITVMVFLLSIVTGAVIDSIGCCMGIHCGSIFSALIMLVYILIRYSN